MKYYLKKITRIEFFERINSILDKIKNQNNNLDQLNEEIINIIKEHFFPNPSILIKLLENYNYSIYNNLKFSEDNEFDEYEREDIYKKVLILIDYLSTIDYLDKQNKFVIINSITDKSEFLLNKLNDLFNDNYYSISLILKLNSIEFRDGEPREIAENLFKRGYLKFEKEYGNSDYVTITIKGANFIERKNKSKLKEKINKNKETRLDKKLDEIKQHLIKLGYGQEIIFDEIEELRELQTSISKKSWKQLLKGKLFDLAMDEVLNKDTANLIYDFLTDSSIKLLK